MHKQLKWAAGLALGLGLLAAHAEPPPGTTNQIPYNAGSFVWGAVPNVNSGVLVTNGSGVPSISTTLPSGLTIPGYISTYPGAGLVQSTGSAWGTSITPGTGIAAALAGNVSGSSNSILETNGSGASLTGLLWSQIGSTPTTLSGYGIVSPLPVAQGGTAASSASGTALDNITGFSSTGLIDRTGAGAYSFTTPGAGVLTALGNATNASGGVVTSPVANANLANSSTTVNSQSCALGGTCTVTVSIGSGVTGLGSGVATALADAVGASGAFLVGSTSNTGTGVTLLTSTNTGASNLIETGNAGTVSNAATVAGFEAILTAGTNAYVYMNMLGGASPQGVISTGTGATGGLAISGGGGTLSIASPTVTGSFTATGLVTNADLANSTITLGSSTLTLGGTTTSISGLTLPSPTFSGTVAGAGTIPNTVLVNSTITLGSSTLTLGGTTTSVSGLTLASPALSGTVTGTGTIPLSILASQSANTVVGALTATNPSALSVPSCSGSTNALIWTSGTGFGCNTITGGTGTVTTTSSPANGNLTQFSGATSITNGNLSGDCTTSNTLSVTCSKIGGVAVSLGGAFTMSGAFTFTGTVTANTTVTFPTSGTLLTTTGSGASLTGITYSQLPTLSANQLLGALTATTPSGQSVPSCSTSASALQWTSGTGFGCNTAIAASTVTTNANLTGPITSTGNATAIASQTGTGSTFVVSAGPTITGTLTSSGTFNATGTFQVSGTTYTWPGTTGPVVVGGDTTTLSTGAGQTTNLTSANTGFTNFLEIANTGTSSNAATIAGMSPQLGCANCYILLQASGGASPIASLNSGSGLTGGFTISASAGTLSIASPTVTGSFTATGLVTNADLANSTITLGSSTLTLGGTTTSVSGLTLPSPTFSGTVAGTGTIPLSVLASQSANTVVGALTATNPSALAVPSCSAAGNALNWTSGTGFGCATGYLTANQTITLSGDISGSGTTAITTTLATVNSNTGAFGSATSCPTITLNGKGLATAASATTCTPAIGSVTGLGANVATALGVAVGSAGAVVTNGGALGTPSSGTATNLTGTAAGLTAGIANAIASATTTVNTSAATAPTLGKVLTATSGTTATWQTPADGGGAALSLLYNAWASVGSQIVRLANLGDSILTCNQQAPCTYGPQRIGSTFALFLIDELAQRFPQYSTGYRVVERLANGSTTVSAGDGYTLTSGTATNSTLLGPQQSGVSLNGGSLFTFSSGAVLTIAVGQPYSSVNIACVQGTGISGYTVTINGSSVGTACGSGSGASTAVIQNFANPVAFASQPATGSTLTLTALGATNYLYAYEGVLFCGAANTACTSGFAVDNWGVGGASSPWFASGTKSGSTDGGMVWVKAASGQLAMCVLENGENDANSGSGITSTQQNAQNQIVATDCQTKNASVFFFVPPPYNSGGSPATYAALQQGSLTYCAAQGWACLNMADIFMGDQSGTLSSVFPFSAQDTGMGLTPPWGTAQGLITNSDNQHLTDCGELLITQQFMSIVFKVNYPYPLTQACSQNPQKSAISSAYTNATTGFTIIQGATANTGQLEFVAPVGEAFTSTCTGYMTVGTTGVVSFELVGSAAISNVNITLQYQTAANSVYTFTSATALASALATSSITAASNLQWVMTINGVNSSTANSFAVEAHEASGTLTVPAGASCLTQMNGPQ